MQIVIPVVSWIVFGLVVGFVAQFLMSGRGTGKRNISLLLGAVGALIGGFLGRAFFGADTNMRWQSPEDLTVPSYLLSLITAILGAVILAAAYRISIDKKTADGE